MSQHIYRSQRTDLKTPVRNRYFYGKLLDVFHFELEQRYQNDKRWLLNRLITGPGVVCGLDVQPHDNGRSIVITPGVAIDRWGREIIVNKQSEPQRIPLKRPPEGESRRHEQNQPYDARAEHQQGHPRRHEHRYCDEDFVHVVLCYHECEADPVPALAGGCESIELCAPGSIREQYEIKIKDGKAPQPRRSMIDFIKRDRINHDALVEFVTNPCRDLPDDPCIPLANIAVDEQGEPLEPDDININIRPIVYTNRMLFELIVSLINEE
jgi:hypothetical protein